MDWRLVLALLLVAVKSSARTTLQGILPLQQAKLEDSEAQTTKLESTITNVSALNRGKVTATVGSMLPPKHELILNLPTPDNDHKDLW
ncbi:hypothetical protein GCK32_010607, partial [Trichostrongylus colubriformis]